jgi:hypothetical protein
MNDGVSVTSGIAYIVYVTQSEGSSRTSASLVAESGWQLVALLVPEGLFDTDNDRIIFREIAGQDFGGDAIRDTRLN